MSRGCDRAVSHSVLYSRQKSIQPIGARVTAPTVAKLECSMRDSALLLTLLPSDATRSPACAGAARKAAVQIRSAALIARAPLSIRELIVVTPSRRREATFA